MAIGPTLSRLDWIKCLFMHRLHSGPVLPIHLFEWLVSRYPQRLIPLFNQQKPLHTFPCPWSVAACLLFQTTRIDSQQHAPSHAPSHARVQCFNRPLPHLFPEGPLQYNDNRHFLHISPSSRAYLLCSNGAAPNTVCDSSFYPTPLLGLVSSPSPQPLCAPHCSIRFTISIWYHHGGIAPLCTLCVPLRWTDLFPVVMRPPAFRARPSPSFSHCSVDHCR
ncbi:MAG: hypothetical protein J3Q66DRAFT_17228 [Benniella sp.]|nr:MAG: hypothetical protein J3Q66DRAFT_17228 [Benniella sp.]